MSNKKTSYSSYITKVSEKNYRVNFSYISPDTNERKRTCKRGFEKKKDAEEWIKNELPAFIISPSASEPYAPAAAGGRASHNSRPGSR